MGTGKCRLTLKGHSQSVSCACFAPSSKTVATGSMDHSVRIWSTESGDCLALLSLEAIVQTISFSSDGNFVEVGVPTCVSSRRKVLATRYWDWAIGKLLT